MCSTIGFAPGDTSAPGGCLVSVCGQWKGREALILNKVESRGREDSGKVTQGEPVPGRNFDERTPLILPLLKGLVKGGIGDRLG